ncbi:MAG: hypothetical protein QNK37_10090 [Acidobacteriota bacterium]|nr:hypothetical protein [Acidobacteriota bacterium]
MCARDNSTWQHGEKLKHAEAISEEIAKLQDLVVRYYKEGRLKPERGATIMDGAYFELAVYLKSVGEYDNAALFMEQGLRFSKGTSIEPNRISYMGDLFARRDDHRSLKILEEYAQRPGFMTGHLEKTAEDAQLALSLALAYQRLENFSASAQAFEDFFDWIEDHQYRVGPETRTILNIYRKVRARGKGRYHDRRVASMVHMINDNLSGSNRRWSGPDLTDSRQLDREIAAANFVEIYGRP